MSCPSPPPKKKKSPPKATVEMMENSQRKKYKKENMLSILEGSSTHRGEICFSLISTPMLASSTLWSYMEQVQFFSQ